MFLRFVLQVLLTVAVAAAEQCRTMQSMLSERPARALLMLARCMQSPFALVRLLQPRIRRALPRC